jgi:AcrR family transcriptional regulator
VLVLTEPQATRRASPLAADDRRAMIIDAVIPLLVKHGADVTSKQIAEAAGIAEGTVFRAFGDKETLIRAAVDKYIGSSHVRTPLAQINPHLALEDKVCAAVTILQARFRDVFRMVAILGEHRPHTGRKSHEGITEIFTAILEPDLARLNVGPEMVANVIRWLTFASSLPPLNNGVGYTPEELTDIILYGVAGARPEPQS